jgi:hypothetical protein
MEDRVRRIEPAKPEFWARLCVSMVFSLAGFAIVMLGLGDQASARMAAGWLGAVLGFWLR